MCVEKQSACTKLVHYPKYLPDNLLVKVVAKWSWRLSRAIGSVSAVGLRVFLASVSVRCGVVFVLSVRFFDLRRFCDRFGSVCISFGFGAAFCMVETAMISDK